MSNPIEITPALLADLRGKAENSGGLQWRREPEKDRIVDSLGNVIVADTGAGGPDFDHIAAASPAVVLALVQEIERLKWGLEESVKYADFSWDQTDTVADKVYAILNKAKEEQ